MDTLKATGTVSIQVFERGKLVSSFEQNNLVVTLGKTNIAKLLGGDAAGKRISKIAVGTGNTAATVDDNALTSQFNKDILNVSYPDAQSVQFNFSLDNADANGKTIREFGLLNSDNVLCARKVRTGEIVKTDLVQIVGSWKITIN